MMMGQLEKKEMLELLFFECAGWKEMNRSCLSVAELKMKQIVTEKQNERDKGKVRETQRHRDRETERRRERKRETEKD